jgi:ribosome biogenesis GTPase A
MQAKVFHVVLEVHDARVPLSGRNSQFDVFRHRPRLVALNKVDLTDPATLAVSDERKERRTKQAHVIIGQRAKGHESSQRHWDLIFSLLFFLGVSGDQVILREAGHSLCVHRLPAAA